MAEIVKTVKIETGSGERSVKSLKKEISDLRDALLNMEKGGEEWKKTADELTKAQEDLNSVMKAGKEAADADATSIAGMEARYKSLYSTYKMLSDEQRKTAKGISMQKELAELSKNLNSTKKDAGNFKDNIGHYADDMMSAFGQLGISVGNLQGPLKMATNGSNLLKKAWDALKAHPILAVLAILIGLFNKVKDAIAGNEELQLRMNKVMAAFKPIGDAVAIALDKIAGLAVTVAEGIAKVVTWLSKLLGISGQVIDAEAELAEKENQLIKDRREFESLNAEDEARVAQLREEAAITNDIVEKETKLNEAKEIQERINKRNLKLAEDELDIIKTKNSLTPSSTADLDAEAAAQEKVNQVVADGANKVKSLNDGIKSAQGAASSAAADAKKELDEILKRLEDNSKTEIQKLTEKYEKEKALLVKYHKDTTKLEAEYQKNLEKLRNDQLIARWNAEEAFNDAYINNLAKPSTLAFEAMIERAQGKLNNAKIAMMNVNGGTPLTENGEFTNSGRLANEKLGLGIDPKGGEENAVDILRQKKREFELELEKLKREQAAWFDETATMASEVGILGINLMLINSASTTEEYYNAMAHLNAAESAALQEKFEIAEDNWNKIKDLNEEELNELGLTLNDRYDLEKAYYEAKAALRDKDLEGEIAKRERERELEEEKKAAIEELTFSSLDSMNSIIETTKTLIDAYKKDGEISEKEAKKKAKTMQWLEGIQGAVAVAGIVADTASGWMAINRALAEEYIGNAMTAAATGPAYVATKTALDAKSLITANIRKAVLLVNGATAAAAAVGKTIANIKALGADTGDGSGGTGSATATPALIESTPYSYTRELQTDIEREEMLNTPIYVRVTDIDAAQARVKVTNRETTF